MRFCLMLCVSALIIGAEMPTWAQVSARDAFWSASDLVSVAANPGAKVKSARSGSVASKQSAPRPRDTKAAAQLIALNGYGEQPHLVHTSLKTQQLGLRYSVLKQQEDGSYAEVSADNIFHNGDALRLSIMSNEPGYLYVIQQGSSGAWQPLFPNAQSSSNRVKAGIPYQVPGDPQKFAVDNNPGTEKLFVVLSREPIADLDGAVNRLQKSPTAEPQPARIPDQSQIMEASNRIPDVLVQQLASRDLTLVTEQKVDSTATHSTNAEKAVYVVAKQDASATAHEVIARVTLNHE